ncbi:MAG: sialidase family protein [Actinomycetota bacterium]
MPRTPHHPRRRTRIVVSIAALTAMACLATSSAAADARPKRSPDVEVRQISGPSPMSSCNPPADYAGTRNHEHQVSLAVNPSNDGNMVATWTQDWDDGTVVSVTSDGGQTWSAVGVPGQMPGCHDEPPLDGANNGRSAVSPDGTIYTLSNILFSGDRTADHQQVRVNATRDGGATWAGSTTLDTGNLDWVWPVADAHVPGTAYVLWGHREGNSWTGIATAYEYISTTTTYGDEWSAPLRIAEPPAGSTYQWGQLLQLPDGSLVDVFFQCLAGVDVDQPVIQCESGGGVAHAVRSTTGGQSWSAVADCPPLPLPPENNGFFDSAVTAAGEILVGYSIPSADASGWRIMLTRSSDGGCTWSEPEELATDTAQPSLVQIEATAKDTVGVLFYDNRSGVTCDQVVCPPTDTDVWFRTVHHGASTETRVDGPFDINALPVTACCTGVGEWAGLVPTSTGFAAAFVMGKPRATIGPTDVFLASIPVRR